MARTLVAAVLALLVAANTVAAVQVVNSFEMGAEIGEWTDPDLRLTVSTAFVTGGNFNGDLYVPTGGDPVTIYIDLATYPKPVRQVGNDYLALDVWGNGQGQTLWIIVYDAGACAAGCSGNSTTVNGDATVDDPDIVWIDLAALGVDDPTFIYVVRPPTGFDHSIWIDYLRYTDDVTTLPQTLTQTPTRTHTEVLSETPTYTATPSCTQSASSSASPTASPTSSLTASHTLTRTQPSTLTTTRTASRTCTCLPTPTNTPTASPTPSHTPTMTRTWTPSHTPTHSGTATATPTASPTGTESPVWTGTASFTHTRTCSATPTLPPQELAIVEDRFYPNPWDGEGELHLAFMLTAPCEKVVVNVYSLSHRPLYREELEMPAAGTYIEVACHEDDALGKLANGAYYYLIEAYVGGNVEARKLGKVVVLK